MLWITSLSNYVHNVTLFRQITIIAVMVSSFIALPISTFAQSLYYNVIKDCDVYANSNSQNSIAKLKKGDIITARESSNGRTFIEGSPIAREGWVDSENLNERIICLKSRSEDPHGQYAFSDASGLHQVIKTGSIYNTPGGVKVGKIHQGEKISTGTVRGIWAKTDGEWVKFKNLKLILRG
jgi:ribosomal protein L27